MILWIGVIKQKYQQTKYDIFKEQEFIKINLLHSTNTVCLIFFTAFFPFFNKLLHIQIKTG